VHTDFTYLSYTAYANSIAVDSIGQSYHGKLTLHEALQQWGESLKKYGEEIRLHRTVGRVPTRLRPEQ
jgi:hypothetical protein